MKKGTCKHYTGFTLFRTAGQCRAGVNYRDVTPDPDTSGCALRIPCHTVCNFYQPGQLAEFARRGTCAKYEEPTDAEVAAHEAEIEAMIAKSEAQMAATTPLLKRIKKDHKGQDWQGVEVCPVCGGKLHLSHAAYNGHVHGRCETEDCLNWME
jgi:hypothetical protein